MKTTAFIIVFLVAITFATSSYSQSTYCFHCKKFHGPVQRTEPRYEQDNVYSYDWASSSLSDVNFNQKSFSNGPHVLYVPTPQSVKGQRFDQTLDRIERVLNLTGQVIYIYKDIRALRYTPQLDPAYYYPPQTQYY